MWQRFTEKARKVVFYAQEEAQKCAHSDVSTEHLLLGLLREENLGRQILDQMLASRGAIPDILEPLMVRGSGAEPWDCTLTEPAKRVIDLAYEESRTLKDKHIGTEHLLLGLLRAKGLASMVLEELGVEGDAARQIVLDIRAEVES